MAFRFLREYHYRKGEKVVSKLLVILVGSMNTDPRAVLTTEGAEILTGLQEIGNVTLELLRSGTASFKYKQLKVE